ncbi:MAG: hypothetical protein LBB60_10945 [Desulfovibrio sp.]|jgi:hypothetical protein|nr:hypothetical protein [Desulfovibrio sp.]
MSLDLTTFTSIAACLSGLGACASAWGTLRAVGEMRKQREESYRPDIACSVLVFGNAAQSSTIQICNVGLGVAKNVAVNISAPLDDVLPDINEAFQEENCRISHEDNIFKFESSVDDETGFSETFSMPCVTRIKYLFPGMDNVVEAGIPNYFQRLLALMAARAFEKEDGRVKELLRRIKLKIHTDFFDVGGKKFSMECIYTFFDALYDYEKRTYQFRFI